MKYQHYMKTTHKIYYEDARNMQAIPSGSVHLVATSPPYPMIEMWDEMFSHLNPDITAALSKDDAFLAFELMHSQLDPVWHEAHRILIDGGIACINVGDATRTIGGDFMLYPNHARILTAMIDAGFKSLPTILWRKPTNAPNKFMGSGMLPAGAYVTLEHEYILIFRKGSKREFKTDQEKRQRRQSAFFWEERNAWFSDVWLDLVGTSQHRQTKNTRLRSAAYPFDLPYRLINMFSAKNDMVVDPFLGTGTTMAAAMASARNSIGFEIDPGFEDQILSNGDTIVEASNSRIKQRIDKHVDFIDQRSKQNYAFRHFNAHYDFAVMTRQEVDLFINPLERIERIDNRTIGVTYTAAPRTDARRNRQDLIPPDRKKGNKQLNRF